MLEETKQRKERLAKRWQSVEGQARLYGVIEALRAGEPWQAVVADMPDVDEVENGRDLRAAPLQRVDLSGVQIRNVRLDFADFSDARLTRCDLRGSQMLYSNFSRADLQHANLEGCLMARAYFVGSSLKQANLKSAALTGADAKGADFSDADLTDASLFGANIEGAVFAGAILENTRFGDFEE